MQMPGLGQQTKRCTDTISSGDLAGFQHLANSGMLGGEHDATLNVGVDDTEQGQLLGLGLGSGQCCGGHRSTAKICFWFMARVVSFSCMASSPWGWWAARIMTGQPFGVSVQPLMVM